VENITRRPQIGDTLIQAVTSAWTPLHIIITHYTNVLTSKLPIFSFLEMVGMTVSILLIRRVKWFKHNSQILCKTI